MKTNEKDIKQGIVPALRFPEFRKNAEWNIYHLRQISTRIITRVGNSKLLPVSISAGVGFLPQTEKFGRDISGEQYRNYIVLNRGEFAYNKGNSKKYPQGCVYRLEEFDRVAAPNAFLCFRFDDNVLPDFFKGYFDSNYHGKQLKNIITSGARSNGLLNISADEFFNIVLPTPKDREEQQKIADCLSSIDALIKAAENKVEELKAHKKGLMQQLFPAEGETVPALRFPEFQNAGEWTKISLGELTYKVSKKNKDGKLYPIYSINNKQGFIRQEEQFTGVDSNDRGYDLSLYNIVGNKTFAYNPARINVGSIGYSGDLKDIIISSLYVCFKTCETVNDEFLLKYFETESFKKAVLNSVEGGIRSYLFYDNFAKINLYLPPNYDTAEQQKIADCLSSVDNLIIAQTNRLEALKAHKRGLMQQLFPNIE